MHIAVSWQKHCTPHWTMPITVNSNFILYKCVHSVNVHEHYSQKSTFTT